MNPSLVVIGASLGGLAALRVVLGRLPPDYPLPVGVVQHRAVTASTDELAEMLARWTLLPVQDADDKMAIEPGRVVLAPPDYHMLVERGHYGLSTAPPVSFARPSVDLLFHSAAEAYGKGVVAAVLTGSNRDGAHGARAVSDAGGLVLVQDPKTAEAPEMPRAALAALGWDAGLSLEALADELASLHPVPKGGMLGGHSRPRSHTHRR